MDITSTAQAALSKIQTVATKDPGKVLTKTLGVGIAAFTTRGDYHDRLKQGQNPLYAAAVAATQGYLGLTMGVLPYMAVTQAPALVRTAASAYYSHYQGHSAWRRSAVTAFSHSYQHTDVTLKMQQQGLNAINRAKGSAGAEAGMFAQAYGRR